LSPDSRSDDVVLAFSGAMAHTLGVMSSREQALSSE
jgi:hypothetical protein